MAGIFDQLLAEFRAFLEDRGGSAPVRDFLGGLDWDMKPRALEPKRLACLRHLPRTAEISAPLAKPLADLLAKESARFHWGQTYTAADFDQRFIDNYGWLEVFGTRGHFANDRMAAGLLILGPGIVYPDHHHVAEEVYIPLTGGTEWRMGDAPFAFRAACEVIHHASNVSHAMRTGAEPLLALYLWRGGPLAAKSTIGSGKR